MRLKRPGELGYPVPGNVAPRSRERGAFPGGGPGPRPAAPAAPPALPPPALLGSGCATCGRRCRSCVSRDCVGGRAWARGEDNCVVGGGTGCCRGLMTMRLNSLGTPARRAQDLLAYGKMSHRALSFITPLPLLAGPCWSALSHRQVQVQ